MRTRSTSLSVAFLSAALLVGAVPPPPDRPRLPHTIPAGKREILVTGHLFIPQKLLRKKRMPLLVHFHGAAWVAETAAAKDDRWAVISFESGEGADVYSRQFSDHGIRFSPIVVSAWSLVMGLSAKFWKCRPITAGWIKCFC